MYTGIAQVYDQVNYDVNYNQWVVYIEKIFDRFGCKPKIILELACGTGSFAIQMVQKGYEMICSDISEEMLSVAREKAEKANSDILFLQQDMTDFELYGTVGAIVCLLDSVNHVTDHKELERMIKLCHNYLDYDGLLIFDVNTEHKLKHIYSDNVFYVDYEDYTCIWQCDYRSEERESVIELTLFKKEGNLYQRYDDTIIEKAYQLDYIKSICIDAGLECLGIFNEFTLSDCDQDSERVFFICKKGRGN